MSHTLDPKVQYTGVVGGVSWEGRSLEDEASFRRYLREVVGPRVRDEEDGGLREVLAGLATTGMETDHLAKLLASVPPVESWEVGEALAECILRDIDEGQVIWPWNLVADRRTPRASLPGADLVGLSKRPDGAILVFGEVKTSSDKASPPAVMYGGSGMVWQLADEATNLSVHHSLLVWLLRRCTAPVTRSLFEAAVKRYLSSGGTNILLVGVLLRDTEPEEKDVRSRAEHLHARCSDEMRVRVTAWYCPVQIDEWPSAIEEQVA